MKQLPPILREIAEVAGMKAAVDLVARFGGQRIAVPKRPTPKSPIARAVGIDAARAIGRRWGSEVLDVPNLRWRKNREAVARLVERGASANEIARQLDFSRRHVIRVRGEIRRETPPPLLALLEGDNAVEIPRGHRGDDQGITRSSKA